MLIPEASERSPTVNSIFANFERDYEWINDIYDEYNRYLRLFLSGLSTVDPRVSEWVDTSRTNRTFDPNSTVTRPAYASIDALKTAIPLPQIKAYFKLSVGGITLREANLNIVNPVHDKLVRSAQIQSDWNQDTTSAIDFIKNKPTLATVATTGSYSDLTGRPSIPTDTTIFKGTYADNTAYAIGNIVIYNNGVFLCITAVDNTNTASPVAGAVWEQLDVGSPMDIISVAKSGDDLVFTRRNLTTQSIAVASVLTQEQVYQHADDIITAGTGITVVDSDSDNTITINRDALVANDIPNLDADKITTGTLDSERLSSGGNAGQVLTRTSGGHDWQDAAGAITQQQVYDHSATIVTGGTGITVVDSDIYNTITINRDALTASDIPNLNVDKITTGTFGSERLSSG